MFVDDDVMGGRSSGALSFDDGTISDGLDGPFRLEIDWIDICPA